MKMANGWNTKKKIMNKLSRREYIIKVAEALVKEYGDTLVDYDTDIQLATSVVDELTPYLNINPDDIFQKDFLKWKKESRAHLRL